MMLLLLNMNIYAKDQIGTLLQNTPAYETEIDFKPICYVFKGESFAIVEETDTNYGILLQNHELVYVNKAYVAVEEIKPAIKNEVLIEEVPENTHSLEELTTRGEEVVELAKKYVGIPYVYGGNSLITGVDCSGFTKEIYKAFGATLERTSIDQYQKDGIAVTRSDLKPGDLVFYGYGEIITHVAIYVGNDQIIHSPAPGQSVCISPIWQNGNAPLVGYKRIFI